MSSQVFLTSDLHLGHSNIIRYCNRPYRDVDEMNEDLIRKWNEVVTDNDRVFFLGDFGLGTREDVIRWGNRLNGRKVMIYGNHDHFQPSTYYKAGFQHVSRWPIVIEKMYLLSHAPMRSDPDAADIGGLINIHGHIHNKVDQGPTIAADSACVCVERWGYQPVKLSEIINRIQEFRVKK